MNESPSKQPPPNLEQLEAEAYRLHQSIVASNEELVALLLQLREREQAAIHTARQELARIRPLLRKAHRDAGKAKLYLAEHRPLLF